MAQGPIELPATPVTAPGVEPPIGEPVYLGPKFVGDPTVPINIPGLPSVNFGPITSQVQYRRAMAAYLSSVYEKETKRIHEEYFASAASLASTLQKELDVARGGSYVGDAVSVASLLREIQLRENSINQKSIERQNQQAKSNSFYSADFSSKGSVDFIRTVTDLVISGNAAVNVIPRWQESLAAAYQARYLGDQIDLLNAQAATLRGQLAAAQAAQREAQAVLQSISSELSAITAPAQQHLAAHRKALEDQFSESSTRTHAERQAATQAVQQAVEQTYQQIEAFIASASNQVNAAELAQISQSTSAMADAIAATFSDAANQLVANANALIESQRHTTGQAGTNAAAQVSARVAELIAQVQASPTRDIAVSAQQSLKLAIDTAYATASDQINVASHADTVNRQEVSAGIQSALNSAQTQLQALPSTTQAAIVQAANSYRFAASASAALTVPGQGAISLAETVLATLRQGIANAIVALGRIATAGPGGLIAIATTAAVFYARSTASEEQDQTPARFRYSLGVRAHDLGLPAAADLNAIASAQGQVELPYRLTNETRGDGRSYVSVVNADGVNISKSVPVRAATFDPQTGSYTVSVPSLVPDQPPITLTWTPAAPPGDQSSSTTTPIVSPPVPTYTGVELQPLSIEAETYPGVVPDVLDLIITFPADSGLEPIYLMFSEPLDSGIFTRSQLDKKYKHAKSFGIADPQKNGKTLAAFRDAIQTHLEDKDTLEKGSYLYSNGSRVYFNPTTKNVVILDSSGAFLSGWKLSPGTPQYEVYINTGRLK